MKLKYIPFIIALTFSSLAFSQSSENEGTDKILKDNFPSGFFYKPAETNFFKKAKFQKEYAEIIAIQYDKYALEDLGVNEILYKKHINNFLSHTYDFLEDKEVDGPLLISFNLKAQNNKDPSVICKETPKKCSLNTIEFLFQKEYKDFSEKIPEYVFKKLEKDGERAISIEDDISEPIISNFSYIGSMNTVILLNLTPKKNQTNDYRKTLSKLIKSLPDLVYPEGEETAKKYSLLQKQYNEINGLNSNPLNEDEDEDVTDNSEDKDKDIPSKSNLPNIKSSHKSDKDTEIKKQNAITQEFNQLREKLNPLTPEEKSHLLSI